MNAAEFRQWLEGFLASGGDPTTPEGRHQVLEKLEEGGEPDPICAEDPHHPDCAKHWVADFLRYYDDSAA